MNRWRGWEAHQGRVGCSTVGTWWGHWNHSLPQRLYEAPPTLQMVNMLRVLFRTYHLLLAAISTRSGRGEGSMCLSPFFFPLSGCLGCLVMNRCCHQLVYCTYTHSSLQPFLRSMPPNISPTPPLIDLPTPPVIHKPVILNLYTFPLLIFFLDLQTPEDECSRFLGSINVTASQPWRTVTWTTPPWKLQTHKSGKILLLLLTTA